MTQSLVRLFLKVQQNGQPRICFFVFAETRPLIQIGSAIVAETLAVFSTGKSHRDRKLNLLQDHKVYIKYNAVIVCNFHFLIPEFNLRVMASPFGLRQIRQIENRCKGLGKLLCTTGASETNGRFDGSVHVKIAISVAKNKVGGYRFCQRRIYMRKPYFFDWIDMADMKRFGFQVLNFNEHGQNSCFSARGKIYYRKRFVKDKAHGNTRTYSTKPHYLDFSMPEKSATPIQGSGLWLRTGPGRLLQFIQFHHQPLLEKTELLALRACVAQNFNGFIALALGDQGFGQIDV